MRKVLATSVITLCMVGLSAFYVFATQATAPAASENKSISSPPLAKTPDSSDQTNEPKSAKEHQIQTEQKEELSTSPEKKKAESPEQKKHPQTERPDSGPKTTTASNPTTAASKPASKSHATTSQLNPLESEVIELVNAERKKRGLKPLIASIQVSNVARKKSEDMKVNNYFDHHSPTYGSPFDMLKQFGVSYMAAGENIAAGQRTSQQVMDAWMNSDGHRANILNPSYTHIGVGYVKGGSYGTYWTQMFISK